MGAEPVAAGVHFRVWAPKHNAVAVVLSRDGEESCAALELEEDGYWSGLVRTARTGDRYWYELGPAGRFPDPASRFQPEGPHGPSEVVDPRAFAWTDVAWPGVGAEGHVIYEMHVGTFTPEGTWEAAARRLADLARLGITTVEMMPVAEWAGAFGWGYDGVDLYAPTRLYGRPDDLRAFVDRAHAVGLAVILDVVYNHLGPDGCYLSLHRDLIALRRSDPAIAAGAKGLLDGAVLAPQAFAIRYFGAEEGDRLLLVNLGQDWQPRALPEPLLAPPAGHRWQTAWSSEDPAYGGDGTAAFDPDGTWLVSGQAALYLRSVPRKEDSDASE